MSNVYYPRALVTIQSTLETLGESGKILAFDANPRRISVKRNSYKQPDSWSVEFDAKDFPIPPALVRSGNIKIFLYDSGNREISRGEVLQREPTIAGVLDEIQTDFNEDGRVTRMDGQDYTVILAEHLFQKTEVKSNGRLDQVLERLLREVDPGTGGRLPALNLVTELPDNFRLPLANAGATKTNKKRGFPVKKGSSYWDVMYKLAIKHGFILFVRGLKLVLTLPQYQTSEGGPSDPYYLTWGYDVAGLNMSRNMGKNMVPQIEVRCYDDSARKTRFARYPDKKQKVTTGVGTKRNERSISVVYGIKDSAALKRAARSIHEAVSRTEQEVEVRTNNMKDTFGLDLINIKTGDSLYLSFKPYNRELLQKMEEAERAQWLIEKGFLPETAGEIARQFKVLDSFKKPFYIREADIEYSIEDGFSLSLRCVNFISKDGLQETGGIKDNKPVEKQ